MDNPNATLPTAVLDCVECSLKAALKELQEARILDKACTDRRYVPSDIAVEESLCPSCEHCGMDPAAVPSPAVLKTGLKRTSTPVNPESDRRVSPPIAGLPSLAIERAEANLGNKHGPSMKESKTRGSLLQYLLSSCLSFVSESREVMLSRPQLVRYRQQIAHCQYISWAVYESRDPPIPRIFPPFL